MTNLEVIKNASTSLEDATTAYGVAKTQFGLLEAEYLKLIVADPKGSVLALVKKFGPKLALFAGLPGGGALLSQPGFLDKVTGLLGGLFGG